MMKRSTFLRTLAGSVLVVPQLAEAETPEEKEIYDLLDASVGGGSRTRRTNHSSGPRFGGCHA